MESEHVGPFNLGNPGEFPMLELAGVSYDYLRTCEMYMQHIHLVLSAKICYETKKVVKEVIDPSATIGFKANTTDDPHKRKPDISKAKELLNWEPKFSLQEGLPLMVNDFRNRILNEDEGKGN